MSPDATALNPGEIPSKSTPPWVNDKEWGAKWPKHTERSRKILNSYKDLVRDDVPQEAKDTVSQMPAGSRDQLIGWVILSKDFSDKRFPYWTVRTPESDIFVKQCEDFEKRHSKLKTYSEAARASVVSRTVDPAPPYPKSSAFQLNYNQEQRSDWRLCAGVRGTLLLLRTGTIATKPDELYQLTADVWEKGNYQHSTGYMSVYGKPCTSSAE